MADAIAVDAEAQEMVSMNDETHSPGTDAELADQWAAGRCPFIDGIVFGDGRVKRVLAAWHDRGDGEPGIVIEPGGWTTLDELRAGGSLDWTSACEACTAEDPARGIRVEGGEGSWGSDGFVAALRWDGGGILWIAFFATSNPFEAVRIEGDAVLARTNLGTWWRFPIDAPERVALA